MRIMLKSRLECKVDEVKLDYAGSLTLPFSVMLDKNIAPLEQIHVLNKNNGARFITYAIAGNCVCLNGAAARMGIVGDELIILTYEIR